MWKSDAALLPSFLFVAEILTMDEIEEDPTWLTDERIREIKHGEDATPEEALALAGEVRVRRRAMKGESWRDRPPLL